jgi:hypothetical protein
MAVIPMPTTVAWDPLFQGSSFSLMKMSQTIAL